MEGCLAQPVEIVIVGVRAVMPVTGTIGGRYETGLAASSRIPVTSRKVTSK
jgi:hypothetical protein